MSVAFRRESDEEHKEPRFDIPIPPGPNLVTARGLALIEDRVATLEARDAGALIEAERNDLARDLRYWRTRLATARVAPPPPPDTIAFGSRVRFRLNGRERWMRIVGDDEASPADGSIAFTAPLARALIGASVGDTAAFGGRDDAIEVLEIAD